MPAAVSRSCIQAGEGPISTSSMSARVKRRQRSGSAISTEARPSMPGPGLGVEMSGAVSGAPVSAEISRATPRTDRASARFGVRSKT